MLDRFAVALRRGTCTGAMRQIRRCLAAGLQSAKALREAAFRSASRTSASSVASSPSSSTAAATAALASAGLKPRLARAESASCAAPPRGGRAGGRGERRAAELAGEFVDDAHGELGADAVGAGDHRLVAARRWRAASSAGSRVERMASATRPPTPWTLVSCAERLALAGRAEAEQGHRILAHLHFGEQHDLAADRAERVEGAGRWRARDSRRRRRRSPRRRRWFRRGFR